MTYQLPAVGKQPDPPLIGKIAVEEHFDVLGALARGRDDEDLQTLVKAMDYNAGWMDIVGTRLRDFGDARLAGMDASGINVAILSHTVPGVQGHR